MNFVRNHFALLCALFVIYTAFFFTHMQRQHVVLGTALQLTLFEQPQDGKEPILSALSRAQKEVDVEVYLLSDKDILQQLLDDCQRGVVVRVLLEEHPFGGGSINQKTEKELASTCVSVQWANPAFSLTHAKVIIIDTAAVFILTQNLTTAAFTGNREYDVLDTNPQDIVQVANIFRADWERSSPSLSNDNVVVSPVTARPLITALITNATTSLSIEMEVIDDRQIISLLEQQAEHIPVKVIVPSFTDILANKKVAAELTQHHVVVKILRSPYLHAKLIIADDKAYLGSVNLTTQSMDSNREIGIIVAQKDITDELEQDFLSDWESAAQ